MPGRSPPRAPPGSCRQAEFTPASLAARLAALLADPDALDAAAAAAASLAQPDAARRLADLVLSLVRPQTEQVSR